MGNARLLKQLIALSSPMGNAGLLKQLIAESSYEDPSEQSS